MHFLLAKGCSERDGIGTIQIGARGGAGKRSLGKKGPGAGFTKILKNYLINCLSNCLNLAILLILDTYLSKIHKTLSLVT